MEAKTNESSAAEAASTGQLLRRYRKLAGLTAQELAHEVNSKHPDDAITAAVVRMFGIDHFLQYLHSLLHFSHPKTVGTSHFLHFSHRSVDWGPMTRPV